MTGTTRALRMAQRIRKLLTASHLPEVREQLSLWADEFSQKGSRPHRHARHPGSRRTLRGRIAAEGD
jgi:hypothetical protein